MHLVSVSNISKGEMVFSEAGKLLQEDGCWLLPKSFENLNGDVFSLLPNRGVSNHWTGICFIPFHSVRPQEEVWM